jgi:protein-disulfide isomerase
LTAEWSATAAKELGLNVDTFNKCAASQEAKDFVAKGKAEGQRVGVSGTPTIYINGKRTHAHDEAGLEQAIKDAIKEVAS